MAITQKGIYYQDDYSKVADIPNDMQEMAESIDETLNKYVNKVTGKSLSSEDYTTAEKTKLAGIETGATNTTIDNDLSSSSTNPVQNKKVKEALDDKVDKVDGKGLSTNDYTTAEKNKLFGVDLPTVKATGIDIELNGTSEARVVDCIVSGNTKKDSHTGNIDAVSGNIHMKIANGTNSTAEGYKEQNITFPLVNGQQLHLDDYLADDGIHHKRKQVIFDGTENWYEWTLGQGLFYTFINDYLNQNALSSHFKNIINSIITDNNTANSTLAEGQMAFRDGATKDRLYIKFTTIADVNEFKNWLQSNPIIVEYELKQEVIEPYTEEQQEAYNKLQSILMYTEYTKIECTDEIKPILTIEAYRSLKELENEIKELERKTGKVYGVRRKITNNSSSSWERLFDSVGKVANATKNGETVTNDFDNLAPWSEIKSCNYDLTTKKINAWFGDANFKFDGTNGDVFTHIPKTYWNIYQENDYDYILLADYPRAGFMEVDGFFIGRYNASVVSDVLHSYSGLVPTTNKTIGQFRTLANALGSNFSQLDWRYFVLQMLYLVEYANYNSQSMLGNGIHSRKSVKTIVAGNNTNQAIVGSSSGYYVGQTIRIGTSDGGTQVADARKITAIEAYDEDGVTGYALTFDGAAVNIAVDNFVCTMAQETGQCDSLGMKSGCLNNDGYHSVIYRGVENIFANIYAWVDGINIKDNLAYICKDHSEYASDKFSDPYKPLAYTNCNTNGNPKTLGLDVDEPFFRFPTEVGGGSSTYMCDYYYQNTGNRVALVGGDFGSGASDGLWSWSLYYTSSYAKWSVGARVLIDNQ